MAVQLIDGIPHANLMPGEEWKDVIGDSKQSLAVTNHRVVRVETKQGQTSYTVLFLDKVSSIQYTRTMPWAYLIVGAIAFLVCGVWGQSVSRRGSDMATAGWIVGLLMLGGCAYGFWQAMKVTLTISTASASVEVASTPSSMQTLLDFADLVQKAAVEKQASGK